MPVNLRPLGVVKEIINACELGITYAYDNLVFVEHSVMIIKFNDKNPSSIGLYFNTDCEEEKRVELLGAIKKEADEREFRAVYKGKFRLKGDEETEKLEITFLEKTTK